MSKSLCTLCPRACRGAEGEIGFCGARKFEGGDTVPLYYGVLSSLALDPIEKKPLARFRPGTAILSAGSYGCNMKCPFCQNFSIAQAKGGQLAEGESRVPPEELVGMALRYRPYKNIGIAFTYNEPLVNYEYVLDCAKLARAEGLEIVLVTNGQIQPEPLEELLPFVTAFNIDLKSFSEEGYRTLGGDLAATLDTIREVAQSSAHLEITTLVVPGLSDSEEEMEAEAAFIAELDPEIPLHLSRYFPAYQSRVPATDVARLRRLKRVADRHLKYVYLGNI